MKRVFPLLAIALSLACVDPPAEGEGDEGEGEEGEGDEGEGDAGEGEGDGVVVDNVAGVPLVFVSRRPQPYGSFYWSPENGGPLDMPGVGARSRVRPAPGGRLLVVDVDSSVRVLVDGGAANDAHIVDVNAPAVSYDGDVIAFAGLVDVDGSGFDDVDYGAGNGARAAGGWRLFLIDADGSDLRQLTDDDDVHDHDAFVEQFGARAGESLLAYDDFDPQFLPDGRLVFSSTRFPGFAHYSGQRTSQLYVVDADGANLHRITSEKNSADRPLVDPLTGEIVYARWWRNLRFPTNSDVTIEAPLNPGIIDDDDIARAQSFQFHLGLKNERYGVEGVDADDPVFEGDTMFRNAWHAASIHPDGTELKMFHGRFRSEFDNHHYGGCFDDDGVLFSNFFPMLNMTEAAGFGGVRVVRRGFGDHDECVAGVCDYAENFVSDSPDGDGIPSFGILDEVYAGEPAILPNPADGDRRTGDLVLSMTSRPADLTQDYGLVFVDRATGSTTTVVDFPGTAELRAVALLPRARPPVLVDAATSPVRTLPPVSVSTTPSDVEQALVKSDGTFTFRVLNVYANGAVDEDIVSAAPIGSATTLRGFADYQRLNPGSFETLDWPILMEVAAVDAGGRAELHPPAHLPLFEDLRNDEFKVPKTGGEYGGRGLHDGAAFVAGMNFGRAGTVARCVGCHTGHSRLPVPDVANEDEAKWTNLAPGATVTLSSVDDENLREQMEASLVDRRARTVDDLFFTWRSKESEGQANQFATLTFPVPIYVREVVLWGQKHQSGGNVTDIVVDGVTVSLVDADDVVVGSVVVDEDVAEAGTVVDVSGVAQVDGVKAVRVDVDSVRGRMFGRAIVSLGEVEVIARGDPP